MAILRPLKNQKELLLDSTRPIGKTLNTDTGRPKSTSAGVLLQCHEATQPRWHVLRATYARELKVQTALQEKGIRTFIPMIWQRCPVKPDMTTPSSFRHPRLDRGSTTPLSPTRSGIPRKLVPAVSGLVFALATREALDAYIHSFGDARPVNYYWDRTTNSPLTVPAKAMEDFITIASTLDEDLIYLTEISEKLREGQEVTILEGPFKGVQGRIVRIKKNRRVMVELPGMMAVASTYVKPNYLKL